MQGRTSCPAGRIHSARSSSFPGGITPWAQLFAESKDPQQPAWSCCATMQPMVLAAIHPGYFDENRIRAELDFIAHARDDSAAHVARKLSLEAELHVRGEPRPWQSGKFPLLAPGTPSSWQIEPAQQWQELEVDASGPVSSDRLELAGPRIPKPRSPHELWAHHKYSVLARGQEDYRDLGREVAAMRSQSDPTELARTLVVLLRQPPGRGNLRNTLEHMWGYVAEGADAQERSRWGNSQGEDLLAFLDRIAELAVEQERTYLLHSTALSELAPWIAGRCFH